MFVIEPSKDFSGTKAGTRYLMERANAGQLMILQTPNSIEYHNHIEPTGTDGTLIVRPGGIGDLVHLHATVREIRKRDGTKPDIAIGGRYMDVMKHHPDVRKVVDYPIRAEALDLYRRIEWMEDSVENESELHMADAFLNTCGFDWQAVEDKRPRMFLPRNVRKWRKGKKLRVGFQVKASAKCRTPTVDLLGKLMGMYHADGWEVYLFGGPKEIQPMKDSPVINTTQFDPPLSILESASLMQTCDLFIAPDSGLLHVAACFQIPSVGLYGPFPADLRIRYSPYNVSIEGKAPCAPCFWHSRGAHFPPGCPSAKKGHCIVLGAITPETVLKAGEMAMEKKRNA